MCKGQIKVNSLPARLCQPAFYESATRDLSQIPSSDFLPPPAQVPCRLTCSPEVLGKGCTKWLDGLCFLPCVVAVAVAVAAVVLFTVKYIF